MIKRYMLFMGECYEPGNGMDSFRWSFDTIEDAEKALVGRIPSSHDHDDYWAEIFDTHTISIVREGHSSDGWRETNDVLDYWKDEYEKVASN